MGQLVHFPTDRIREKRAAGPLTAQGRLIPFISPARLFLATKTVSCPTLKVVTSRLGGIRDPQRAAREHVLSELIRRMPGLPETTRTERLSALLDTPFDLVCDLARDQIKRSKKDRHLHALCQSVWRDIQNPKLREFAQHRSVLLAEAFHLTRQDHRQEVARAQ